MITGPHFATFQEAYLTVLREVTEHPEHAFSTARNQGTEVAGISFRIDDPIDRTPYLEARKANVVFQHAEALWYLAGSDDLDMIGYYAPSLKRFSADGRTLTGTAYGARMFAPDDGGASQFDRVLRLLKDDPTTKRAVLLAMRPEELVDMGNIDVACTLGLQFMLRDGALHASAYMRGNDALVGLLGDVFAFTFIQEYLARLLGVQVGAYTHHVGSMHLNAADSDRAKAILAEAAGPTFPAARMPVSIDAKVLGTVLSWEAELRRNCAVLDTVSTDALGLDAYWTEVLALFEVYRQISHTDQPVADEALSLLRPGHRWLVERRWPERVPPWERS